tara:strand:- start:17429 stop:18154 length:726 start_codon:yes stop_codon:yes gene_type:complete
MPQYNSTGNFRFVDKSWTTQDRLNYYCYFQEQIDLYGQSVDYYTYNFKLSAVDAIYGENTTAGYLSGVKLLMYVDLTEQSIFLSKFGLQADDEVTAFVTISGFYHSLSALSATVPHDRPEPKSGDVFTLTEYGDDRPGGRAGKSFEITQRLDQEVSQINPLMGHYCWILKARRLDYTFRPGLTAEKQSNQVYDDSFAGRLSGGDNPQTPTKTYTGNADEASSSVFDYDSFGNDDDVYGDYG